MTAGDGRVPGGEAEREALAWFRERPERIDWIQTCGEESPRHAATIVRAALARDEPQRLGYRDGFHDGARYARGIDKVTTKMVANVSVPTTDGDTTTVGAGALASRPFPDARWDTRIEAWEAQPPADAHTTTWTDQAALDRLCKILEALIDPMDSDYQGDGGLLWQQWVVPVGLVYDFAADVQDGTVQDAGKREQIVRVARAAISAAVSDRAGTAPTDTTSEETDNG